MLGLLVGFAGVIVLLSRDLTIGAHNSVIGQGYVVELQSEMTELIHANPQTPEERHQVFMLKKRIVDTVLEEARIGKNREIHVKFRTDFLVHKG